MYILITLIRNGESSNVFKEAVAKSPGLTQIYELG